MLFGVEIKGKLRVIYSPYDIEGGWNEVRYPLSRGYQPDSAKQLGCNIIMFAMTQLSYDDETIYNEQRCPSWRWSCLTSDRPVPTRGCGRQFL